jgi:hypothetical protein
VTINVGDAGVELLEKIAENRWKRNTEILFFDLA